MIEPQADSPTANFAAIEIFTEELSLRYNSIFMIKSLLILANISIKNYLNGEERNIIS